MEDRARQKQPPEPAREGHQQQGRFAVAPPSVDRPGLIGSHHDKVDDPAYEDPTAYREPDRADQRREGGRGGGEEEEVKEQMDCDRDSAEQDRWISIVDFEYGPCRTGVRNTGNVLPTATRSTSDLPGSAPHPERSRTRLDGSVSFLFSSFPFRSDVSYPKLIIVVFVSVTAPGASGTLFRLPEPMFIISHRLACCMFELAEITAF
jgi:hypothetical protein